MKEGAQINLSLSALGNVINSLTEKATSTSTTTTTTTTNGNTTTNNGNTH